MRFDPEASYNENKGLAVAREVSTVKHSAVQCGTVQYSTVQCTAPLLLVCCATSLGVNVYPTSH